MKIMTVVGTRPEIIRLSRVMSALDEYTDQTIVHTGQNYDYELNEIFFKDLGIRKPDHFLSAAGKNASETIGQIIIKIDEVLEKVKPEALLILGDTNSCLAALPAKRRKIPVFHMEAGNRCFDQRVPEEINRKIVDHISDVNLTYSDIAREYLLREGLPPERVIKTGSPMFEILNHYKKDIESSNVLEKLKLKKQQYFLVSAHREENIDSKNILLLAESLNAVAEKYGLPVIISMHPRSKKRFDAEKVKFSSNIQTLKPLGFTDYITLQKNAKATLSDSGTITEEASILNFPALNIREAHERPEGMEEASVMMTGVNANRIIQGLEILEKQERNHIEFRPVADYSMPNVSDKVVRIILSYTDYVSRFVWKKDL